MTRHGMTNRECGERLGYTESGISRIRSGQRHPSLMLMVKVSGAFNWTVHEQVDAWLNGDWVEIFNGILENDGERDASI